MIKEIDIEVYNHNRAEVKSLLPDGSVLCDLFTLVDEIEVRRDKNISLPSSEIFELTEEEIKELQPIQE